MGYKECHQWKDRAEFPFRGKRKSDDRQECAKARNTGFCVSPSPGLKQRGKMLYMTALCFVTVSEGLDVTPDSHLCRLRGSRMSDLSVDNWFCISRTDKSWIGFCSPEAL